MINRNLTFSGLLLFVFSITLNAQVKTSYSRMDGKMGGNGTPSTEIELTLLYPKEGIHILPAVTDSVKKFIQEQFFGQFKSKQMPEAMMSRAEKDFYNMYDIAPPSMGILKVFLPFSRIGSYIKSTSILYPLSR